MPILKIKHYPTLILFTNKGTNTVEYDKKLDLVKLLRFLRENTRYGDISYSHFFLASLGLM